jgi:hypothetical protein
MSVKIIFSLVLPFLFTLNCYAQPGSACKYPVIETVNKFDMSPASYTALVLLSDSLRNADDTKLGDCVRKASFWESYARCELILASRPEQTSNSQLQYINSASRAAQKGYSIAKYGSSAQLRLLDICIEAQHAKAGLFYNSENIDTSQYSNTIKTLDSLQLVRKNYKPEIKRATIDTTGNALPAIDTTASKNKLPNHLSSAPAIALNEIVMRVGFLFYRNGNYVSDSCMVTATIIEGPDRIGKLLFFPSKPAGELILTHFSNYRIRFSAPGYADQYRWIPTNGTISNQFSVFFFTEGTSYYYDNYIQLPLQSDSMLIAVRRNPRFPVEQFSAWMKQNGLEGIAPDTLQFFRKTNRQSFGSKDDLLKLLRSNTDKIIWAGPFVGDMNKAIKTFQPDLKIVFLKPLIQLTEAETQKLNFILMSNNAVLKSDGTYSLNPDAGYQVIEVTNQLNQLEFVRYAYPVTETVERVN